MITLLSIASEATALRENPAYLIMGNEKETPAVAVADNTDIPEEVARNFTASDQRDMKRMGKHQQFLRQFRIFTTVAFTSCVMGTWEILLTSNYSGLLDGGLAGLWWSLIWCYFGQTFVVLSLSEMSSMAPTAGGQYHWVCSVRPATRKHYAEGQPIRSRNSHLRPLRRSSATAPAGSQASPGRHSSQWTHTSAPRSCRR